MCYTGVWSSRTFQLWHTLGSVSQIDSTKKLHSRPIDHSKISSRVSWSERQRCNHSPINSFLTSIDKWHGGFKTSQSRWKDPDHVIACVCVDVDKTVDILWRFTRLPSVHALNIASTSGLVLLWREVPDRFGIIFSESSDMKRTASKV